MQFHFQTSRNCFWLMKTNVIAGLSHHTVVVQSTYSIYCSYRNMESTTYTRCQECSNLAVWKQAVAFLEQLNANTGYIFHLHNKAEMCLSSNLSLVPLWESPIKFNKRENKRYYGNLTVQKLLSMYIPDERMMVGKKNTHEKPTLNSTALFHKGMEWAMVLSWVKTTTKIVAFHNSSGFFFFLPSHWN